MLALSSTERSLISRMLEIDESHAPSVISNLIHPTKRDPCLPTDAYIDISDKQSMTCFMTIGASPGEIEEHVLDLLATVALLFRKLESFGLIHFAGTMSIRRLGDYHQSVKYVPTNFIDEDLSELLIPYTQKRFWISQELRDLSKREYKTLEEVRHEKELKKAKDQLKLTRYALALSLLGIIISVVAPRFATTTVEFKRSPLQAELHLQEEAISSLESIKEQILAQNGTLDDLSRSVAGLIQIYITKVHEQVDRNETIKATDEDADG